MTSRRHTLILLAILTVALALRLIALNTREIQYDDAFSIFLSQRPFAEIIKGTAADTMPPLYYFILHVWMSAFGSELAVLRMLGVLFSMATLVIIFDLVRRMVGIEAGLWAAFLTAIAPVQIYHAQDIRMYALLEMSQVIYLWCFIGMLDILNTNRMRAGRWLGLILSGTASMYTHNLAVFGLMLPNIYLLFRRRWKDLGRLIAAQAVIFVLSLPWLLMIPGQIEKIQRAFWTPRPGLVEVIQAVTMLSAYLPLKGIWFGVAVVIAVQILAIITIETIRRLRESAVLQFLATVVLALPGMLFAISYFMRPVFIPRGFLISALAYYGLAGWIIARRERRWIGVILAVSLIAAAAVSLPGMYTYQEFPRSAFHQTAAYLQDIKTPDALILHDNKLSFFPTHYYAPDLPQEFLADEPGSDNDTYAYASQQAIGLIPAEDVSSAVADYDQVFFVVFQRAIDEYLAMGEENHPVLSWLENRYQLIGRRSFTDLIVYEFER